LPTGHGSALDEVKGVTANELFHLRRTAVVLFSVALLGACASVESPRPGKPVAVGEGKTLVFGRLRVTDPERGREFLVFSRDWTEHVIPPDPVLTLELRAMHVPGGAVKYSSNPTPPVEEDGSFHWILEQGEYILASNPRAYGSSRFDPGETTVLARFMVPRGAGTVYLGTLQILVKFGEVEAWKGHEPAYTLVRLVVVDEREQAFTLLHSRYPAVPVPEIVLPMAPELWGRGGGH
jgi:hypothetical protein